MAYTTKINWEQLRSINATSFTGSFQSVGGPLLFPSYILKMVNNTSVLVTISIDGVNNYDVAPAGTFLVYDLTTTVNHESIPTGTQFYVSAAAGTGFFYIVTLYLALM
jgi:hypothetical protein